MSSESGAEGLQTSDPDSAPEPPTEVSTADSKTSPNDTVLIYSGHALTSGEGNALAEMETVKVIVLGGPIGSGKTTLAIGVYEEFRKGPFGEFAFAGSRTLLGFEERCHLSRAASNKIEADTERTKKGLDEVLLHFRVRDVADEAGLINLLVCDLSGEIFEAAAESTDALKAIPFLSRADHITLFVDGARLGDVTQRHSTRQGLLTLLRAGAEAGIFDRRSTIEVVFSKQDVVQSSTTRASVEEFQDETERLCREKYGQKFRSLSFYRVSTRPSPDGGVAKLFSNWATVVSPVQSRIFATGDLSIREIDGFGIDSSGEQRVSS